MYMERERFRLDLLVDPGRIAFGNALWGDAESSSPCRVATPCPETIQP